jgi:hypothetical protein
MRNTEAGEGRREWGEREPMRGLQEGREDTKRKPTRAGCSRMSSSVAHLVPASCPLILTTRGDDTGTVSTT